MYNNYLLTDVLTHSVYGTYFEEPQPGTWRSTEVHSAYCKGAFLAVFCFYWGIWGRYTCCFDRKLFVWPTLVFATGWGWAFASVISILFYYTSVWTGWLDADAPWWGPWAVYAIVWHVGGAMQGPMQDLYWYVD